MFVVRPVTIDDAESVVKLAFQAGYGMTSMPKNSEILHEKVQTSVEAFSRDIATPGEEFYLFVLEDLSTSTVVGTCGLKATTGLTHPNYVYKVRTGTREIKTLETHLEVKLLEATSYSAGPTELCSLYLSPDYRKGSLGKLLSLSRFLFIAEHPHRFHDVLFALMRGIIDKNGRCPFWEGLGRHFLDKDYNEMLELLDEDHAFLPDIIPRYPIYVTLLTYDTQEAIGAAHPNTQPALKMLTDEGFVYEGEIDVFDGGPKVTATVDNIRTIKNSVTASVAEVVDQAVGMESLVANTKIDFRVCYGHAQQLGSNTASITSEVAKALQVNCSDMIRYVFPNSEP